MKFVQYGDRLHVLLREQELYIAFGDKFAYDNFYDTVVHTAHLRQCNNVTLLLERGEAFYAKTVEKIQTEMDT